MLLPGSCLDVLRGSCWRLRCFYLAAVGYVWALLWHVDNVIGPAHARQAVRNGLLSGSCCLVHTVHKLPAEKCAMVFNIFTVSL